MKTVEKGKHTEGPWKGSVIDTDSDFWTELSKNKETCAVGRGMDVIALVYGLSHDRSEDEANASLIAAAPELLVAAQEALLVLNENCTERQKATLGVFSMLEKALSKARHGKGEGR